MLQVENAYFQKARITNTLFGTIRYFKSRFGQLGHFNDRFYNFQCLDMALTSRLWTRMRPPVVVVAGGWGSSSRFQLVAWVYNTVCYIAVNFILIYDFYFYLLSYFFLFPGKIEG